MPTSVSWHIKPNKIKERNMAYRVVIPGTGLVLGVFATEPEAYEVYKKNYTTVCSLQPVIEQI